MASPIPPLASILPPLILGTGTFNTQYNLTVSSIPTNEIISRALKLGIRAFDTSPYYGPSEGLLGRSLFQPAVAKEFPRNSYMILTKCGRIGPNCFDYSAGWIRKSIARSLERLKTEYLDVVYLHDVEFVSPAEVLEGIKELRRMRDEEGNVRYVGISGYPIEVLVSLSEFIRKETDEPIDIVQSYSHFNVQNTRLLTRGLEPFAAAGVDVVTNASVLNMGLLRRDGVPASGQGDWHPAPQELRAAVARVSQEMDQKDEKLEKVAIRYAVESWMRAGEKVGSRGDPALGRFETTEERPATAITPIKPFRRRLGVSVMGVTKIEELDETMRVWRSVLLTMLADDPSLQEEIVQNHGDLDGDYHDLEQGRKRRDEVQERAEEIKTSLGDWYDFSWPSPHVGYQNQKHDGSI